VGDVERQVFVDLVGHDEGVVAVGEFDDEFERRPVEDRAGRIVRGVDQDDPGPVGHRGTEFLRIGLEVRQLHRPVPAPGERDEAAVRVVERFEGHHLVAALDEGEQGGGERFGRSGRDEHLSLGIGCETVETVLVLGDGGAEVEGARARRVLVLAPLDRGDRFGEHGVRSVLVGEPLAEVHRAGLQGEGAHLGEDRRGDGALLVHESGALRCAAPRSVNHHAISLRGLSHRPSPI
jgi:hypothetical protein